MNKNSPWYKANEPEPTPSCEHINTEIVYGDEEVAYPPTLTRDGSYIKCRSMTNTCTDCGEAVPFTAPKVFYEFDYSQKECN